MLHVCFCYIFSIQDVDTFQPVLKIDTDSSIFAASSKYEVYVDKVHVCEASSLIDGIQLVTAIHYVLDVHFSTALNKTYSFLSSYVLGLAQAQNVSAQELFNKIV